MKKITDYEMRREILVLVEERIVALKMMIHLHAKNFPIGCKTGELDDSIEMFTSSTLEELNQQLLDFQE